VKLAQKIRESRLAPIVLSYLGAAWIISEVVAQLIERPRPRSDLCRIY